MIQDKNKGITVVYNYLNLPLEVNFGPNNRIDWTYTATGAKLQKKVYTNGNLTLTQDYVSGFVYKNGSLDFFSTETGRVKNQSGTLKYQYTLQDHLGNTRVMFEETSGTPTAIEESHYYAFGMRIEGLSTSSPDNKFTYNGKELEDDHGLNWYHYGARFYDAQIGRWHVVDPADEFFSPYVYVKNMPVKFVDSDGSRIGIDIQLLQSKEFLEWAKTSESAKILLALFGKGGPLYKYDLSLSRGNHDIASPGQTHLYINSTYQDPLKISQTTINPGDTYKWVVSFDTKQNWNHNVEKTGDGESAHVLYGVYTILSNEMGKAMTYLQIGNTQESEVGFHRSSGWAEYYFELINSMLKEVGSGVDVSKFDSLQNAQGPEATQVLKDYIDYYTNSEIKD